MSAAVRALEPAALWALTRPRGAPWVLALPLLGYGFAHWERARPLTAPGAMALVLCAWFGLHAGTMWLNAALDQDEDAVLFGLPAPVPPGTVPLAYAALASAVLAGVAASPLSGLAAGLCGLLAVAYSHPSLRWKAHPVGGPAVNALGYGLLSPAAGWVLVGVAPTARTASVGALLVLWVCSAMFAAQAFQGVEDRARGYRTLVVTHGPRAAVVAARTLALCALVGLIALAVAGWLPRLTLLSAPLFLRLDAHLRRWAARAEDGTAGDAAEAVRRLLWAGGGLFGCALGQYALDCASGAPPAGLGTAGGF